MNITRFQPVLVQSLLAAIAGTLGAAGVGSAQVNVVFSDTFEAGTAGANVGSAGTTWGKNDITVTQYQTATNPFPSGVVYADLNDAANSAAPSVAVRLMSHANNATNPLISGQVTTYSFDFWEPTRTGDAGVLIAGYYREQANVDLNSAGRNYTATLHDGALAPQALVGGSGAATTYALETVNTLFIVANDSANPVVDYRPSRTLAPTTADVWISRAGAAPEFVFSVNKQNSGVTPVVGVGFRTVNADIERFYVDNVLVLSGATLDRSLVSSKPGDVDGDNDVDLDDFVVIRDNFQKAVTMRTQGDLNVDGVVDFADFRQWKSNATAEAVSAAASGAVPEPSAVALAALALAAGAIRRRRAVKL